MTNNQATIIDTPQRIANYRLKVLRQALKLEVLGGKRRGMSAYSIVKREFGFKGNKREVLTQFEAQLARMS